MNLLAWRARRVGDARLLLCLPAFVLAACTAYTPQALEPTPAPLASRLLPLVVGLGESDVTRPEALRGVTLQTDFATVFRRDLEANVFGKDNERWGFAEFRLTFDGDRVTGGGVALISVSIVTLFVPPLLGAPYSQRERTLQAEIVIYNSRRVETAKYVILGKARYGVSVYTEDGYRRAGIDAAKSVMDDFRRRLATEVDLVNDRLRSTGAIR